MIRLVRKHNFNAQALETGDYALGYDEIIILANVGPFPGGGDCLLVKADGQNTSINSNDLIHDMTGYQIYDG